MGGASSGIGGERRLSRRVPVQVQLLLRCLSSRNGAAGGSQSPGYSFVVFRPWATGYGTQHLCFTIQLLVSQNAGDT